LTTFLSPTVQVASDNRCLLPHGNSCIDLTPENTKAEGLGVIYQNPCHGTGCNFIKPYCRLCANHPSLWYRPYPKCPTCVAAVNVTLKRPKPNTSKDQRCRKPWGNSCTDSTPMNTIMEGLGMYYEFPCQGAGCGFMGAMCRLCAKEKGRVNQPFPECPPCVVY